MNKWRRFSLNFFYGIDFPKGHVGRNVKILKTDNAIIATDTNISIYDKVELLCMVINKNGKVRLEIGKNTLIKAEAVLSVKNGKLFIGENCSIGKRTDIICENAEVRIGNNVRIAAECFILTNNHNFESREIPIWQQGRTHKPVIIEDDVWLGRRAMVMPGVQIGKGSVVSAGAVVTKDVSPYSVVGGVPAELIKTR